MSIYILFLFINVYCLSSLQSVNLQRQIHFSIFLLHHIARALNKTYSHSLSFVNYPADYQWTSKGQITDGINLFRTQRQLIMVVLVLQICCCYFNIKRFQLDLCIDFAGKSTESKYIFMSKRTHKKGKNDRKL